MKLQFKNPMQGDYANGEYVLSAKDQPFDVDARFAAELMKSGLFEEYAEPKPESKKAVTTKKETK